MPKSKISFIEPADIDAAIVVGKGWGSDDIDSITLPDGSQRECVKLTAALASSGEHFLDIGSGNFKGPNLHICPLSSVRVWYDQNTKKWHMVEVDIETG
jgi:hypothetical protein